MANLHKETRRAKIKEGRCIRTRQNGPWVIVKIITDQPSLYGIGAASEHNHATTVATALRKELGTAAYWPQGQPHRGHLAMRVQQRLLAQRLHPQRRVRRH